MSADARSPSERFRLGVNYWPARTAMGWWSDFDRAEVAADFARIAASGLDSVRVFLTWADFQPAPDEVDRRMLERLVVVADLASREGLALVPTFFTGHMSGVNWIPAWALGGTDRDDRFRVVSDGGRHRERVAELVLGPAHRPSSGVAGARDRCSPGRPRSRVDVGSRERELELRHTAESFVRAHVAAADRARRSARADPKRSITVGLHMEDLEEDRKLGPREVSEACDLLSMHGYPIYARWADGPTDEQLLPFLADITRWLGGGRDVVFSEFGLPTYRRGDPVGEAARRQSAVASGRRGGMRPRTRSEP